MSAERPHHELGYSRWDKLNECLHFKGKPVGEAAKRGTDHHDATEGHIRFILNVDGGVQSFDENIIRTAKRILSYFIDQEVDYIEPKLSIQDDEFNEVAFGYADYIGAGSGYQLVVLDLKTGSQPPESYRLQLTGLAYAAMEKYDHTDCKCVLVYADSDEDFVFEITLEEAKEVAWGLINRVKAKAEGPKENQFCTWCAKRMECPVWTLPAAEAITPVREKLLFTQDDALERPEAYMDAFKKLEGIYESWGIKEALKAKLDAGIPVPGWKQQTRKGTASVASVEEVLLNVLPAIGFAKGADFLKVDAAKLQKAWASFTSNPLPVDIIVGEGTTALVQDKKGGAK